VHKPFKMLRMRKEQEDYSGWLTQTEWRTKT
jgi:hypothetical protein